MKINVGVVDVVVMTQTCDLVLSKVDTIVLCPVYNVEDLAEFEGKKSRERTQGR